MGDTGSVAAANFLEKNRSVNTKKHAVFEITSIVGSQKYIDSDVEIKRETEVQIGSLDKSDKVLYSLISKYWQKSNELEREVVRQNDKVKKQKLIVKMQISDRRMSGFRSLLNAELQSRFPEYNPDDLFVRKGFKICKKRD